METRTFSSQRNRGADTIPGDGGSDGTFAVLLHNDAVLGQLLLDKNHLLLPFYYEVTT